MRTLYDNILNFEAVDREFGGRLIEPHRRPWHDAAIEIMLQTQAHFVTTQKRFSALGENIDSCFGHKDITEDFSAMSKFLTLPHPVCWLEVLNEEHQFRQGFLLQEVPQPGLVKLYTFQERFNEGLIANGSFLFVPSVVGVQTTLGDFGKEGHFKVEKGNWLPEDEKQISISNMQKLAKFVLAVNPDFDGYNLSFASGKKVFNKRHTTHTPEQIAAANRNRFYPFFELPYLEGEPDLPAMRYEGQISGGPKIN